MSTLIETIEHFGICLLCKKKCKNKYGGLECENFEWFEGIDWMDKNNDPGFNKAKEDFTMGILGYSGESETDHTDVMIIKLTDHRTVPHKEYFIDINTVDMQDISISQKL